MSLALRSGAPAIATRKVAVLDDDLAYIRLVERILCASGAAVEPITTLDPVEAVAVIVATGCTDALVDVYMYGEALGFTLVRRIRETAATAQLPVVVASGAHRQVGRKAGLLEELGCPLLLKPFEPDDLAIKLEDARRVVPVATGQHPQVIIAVSTLAE